jgi:hypothetical protein
MDARQRSRRHRQPHDCGRDREIDSTITNYKLCREADGSDGCPSGEIKHENVASGRTISVSFDGSNEATITGPKGGTVQVPLVCGP